MAVSQPILVRKLAAPILAPSSAKSTEEEPTSWRLRALQAPPWLVSMIVHLSLVILLGLLVTVGKNPGGNGIPIVCEVPGVDGTGDGGGELTAEALSTSPTL